MRSGLRAMITMADPQGSRSGAPRSRPRLQNPLVPGEILDGALDALAKAEARPPAERADPARIEEDERIVPHPAAIAPRVGVRRLHVERRGDPPRRVVHAAITLRAEIEDVDR